MRLIRFLINHSPRILVLSVLAGLAGGAASTAILVVINAGLERSGSQLTGLFFVFLGLAALGMVTRAGSAILLVIIGESAMLQLRLRISQQILGVPLQRLEETGIPRLLAILTDDIFNILNAIANLPVVCINVAAVLTCLFFLAWQSLSLFLIVIVLIVLLLFTAQVPFMIAAGHFTRARKEHNTVMSHLRALISGIKELKVNRFRRLEFVSELEGSANRYRAHNVKAMRIAVLGATWAEMLSFLTIGLLVFVIPRFMATPNSTLMNFVLIMLYLMEPIEFIQNQAPQFAKGSVALKSIEELGLTLAKTEAEPGIERFAPPQSEWKFIELDEIAFSHHQDGENRRFMLGPISFTVTPGELIFITGGNGSGKTTLAKLLLGLYSPESGQIRLDGKAISDADREDYSQLFSAVFADFFVFDKLLGAEKTGLDEKAEVYLRRFQLDHKVKVEDGMFSTTDLSQGQRRRLALLAAYLEDRPIFLFDEWAADQDPNFKGIFYQEILPELRSRGKTVFVISHDQRYYDIADRVIRLDDGWMVENLPQKAGSSAAGQSVSSAVGSVHNADLL